MLYKVYVDRTDDGIPFYVGKGIERRVKLKKRNRKHSNVAEKYGFNRFVDFETDVEAEAHAKEVEWIAEHKTFHYDYPDSSFSCNFTRGGEGSSGRKASKETRDKQSGAKQGKKWTLEHCRNIGLGKKGKKFPNNSAALKNRIFTVEHKKSISVNRKTEKCRIFEADYARVIELFQSGWSVRKIETEYGVSSPTVYRLLRAHNVRK